MNIKQRANEIQNYAFRKRAAEREKKWKKRASILQQTQHFDIKSDGMDGTCNTCVSVYVVFPLSSLSFPMNTDELGSATCETEFFFVSFVFRLACVTPDVLVFAFFSSLSFFILVCFARFRLMKQIEKEEKNSYIDSNSSQS